MARQPAILEMTGGKSRRQRVWEAILSFGAAPNRFGASFTADELSRKAKVECEPVRYLLKGFVAAGYLRIVEGEAKGGRGVKNVYLQVKSNGVEAPRVRPDGSEITQGRGTEAMWAAMTVLDSFRADFLAEIAQVRVSTAQSYCGTLGRAGYLVAVQPGKGIGRGGVQTVWRVAAEHRQKPRAPMITRLKTVYDPNEHRIVWAEDAEDALELIDAGEVL